MRRCLLIVVSLAMMVLGTGCVVIDVEEMQSCQAGPLGPRATIVYAMHNVERSGFDRNGP